jgi:surface antigen
MSRLSLLKEIKRNKLTRKQLTLSAHALILVTMLLSHAPGASAAAHNKTVKYSSLTAKTIRQQPVPKKKQLNLAEIQNPLLKQVADQVPVQSALPTVAEVAMPVPPKPAPPAIKAVSGTSYPWANAPFPNSIADPWGMYERQCVSYTAWKVASSGRHMPSWGGHGSAKLWDDNARAEGIPVDTTPRVGDVAISNSGSYGHSMYVEAVNGDGTISVSQYNANLDGRYSEAVINSSGLVFIHF